MYVCRSPQKGALLHTYGEKHKVTVHGARCPTQTEDLHTMGCSLVPQGDRYNTAIFTPVPCILRHNTFCLGLGTRAPLVIMCRGNPHQGIPSTPVTVSHVTQGRAEYEPMIPRGTDEGLD